MTLFKSLWRKRHRHKPPVHTFNTHSHTHTHANTHTHTHTHTQTHMKAAHTHRHTHTHNLHHTRQCSNDSQSAAQPLHPHYSIFIVYLLHWLSYSAIQLCVSLAFTFRFAFRLVDSWADVPTCYN